MQIAGDLGELEAVRGGEREHDVVLGRRRLQLEIELAAETLAQRQAPGAVDAAAVGRMDDELHAAGLVEEALEHDRVLRRQAASAACAAARYSTSCSAAASTMPSSSISQRSAVSPLGSLRRRAAMSRAQARHRDRQLVAAARRLAEPERNGRRHAVGILDAHDAALDAQDAIALVAELEDVAGEALDREILVHGADDVVLRLQQHLIVGVVRDRAAGGERGEARAAPAAQHVVDGVVVDERAAPAAPRAEAVGQHVDHGREVLARQRAIGPGAAQQRVELVLAPFPRRHLGHDLLRQHVERLLRGWRAGRARRGRTLSMSAAHSTSSSRESGNSRPLGVPSTAWPERPTRCRKLAIERGEPSWQTRSTSPMSMPSSSDAVATSALSLPCLSRCSASSRCSLARLP